MAGIEERRSGPIAYREIVPDRDEQGPPVVCLHGFPESSRMWIAVMEALEAAGRRVVAPDLFGLGDSESSGPQTFEANLEAFTEFMDGLDFGEVAVCVHDWGGFLGLAWACDHPDDVTGLVISAAGFFADGKWHGMAEAIRSPEGDQIVAGIDRDGFAALLRSSGADAFTDEDIDAYWRPFERRARSAGDARLLSLDGLREARSLAGQARRARGPGPRAVGRQTTSSRRSPPRIASSARSRTRSWWCSTAPGTS